MTPLIDTKNLSQWLEYIQHLHSNVIDFDLARIRPIADQLNLTHFDCPVVVVAGTNGKGSIVRLLESIYTRNEYKVGAYTSPHLIRFNERIRVQNEDVSDESLINAFQSIEAARGAIPLTYFEFTTLTALWIFKQLSLDVIVLEVGMGGRLDAVNIVESDVSVIASISMDHLDYLGKTREAIAYEKCGIMRAGKPCVYGDKDIVKTVIEEAQHKEAILHTPNIVSSEGDAWMRGACLNPENIKVALAVQKLLNIQLPINQESMRSIVLNTPLSGRFECIHFRCCIVYDVAHNPASCEWLAQQLNRQACKGKTIAVTSMLNDKLIKESFAPMVNVVDRWIVADLATEMMGRRSDANLLVEALRANGVNEVEAYKNVEEGFRVALDNCDEDDRIVVFGSFYTVSAVKEFMKEFHP